MYNCTIVHGIHASTPARREPSSYQGDPEKRRSPVFPLAVHRHSASSNRSGRVSPCWSRGRRRSLEAQSKDSAGLVQTAPGWDGGRGCGVCTKSQATTLRMSWSPTHPRPIVVDRGCPMWQDRGRHRYFRNPRTRATSREREMRTSKFSRVIHRWCFFFHLSRKGCLRSMSPWPGPRWEETALVASQTDGESH